jgi:hypothetical protein
VPEGGFAGGKQCVLAGVPAEKVRGAGVCGVVFAGSPDFVEEKGTGLIHAAVEIETQASGFLARGCEEGAKLGLEENVLSFLGAESDDQGNCVFREFGGRGAASTPAGQPLRSFARFPFGHVGGDCTPNSFNGKENWDTSLVHLKVDATDPRRPASKGGPCKGKGNPRTQAEARATGATLPSSGRARWWPLLFVGLFAAGVQAVEVH